MMTKSYAVILAVLLSVLLLPASNSVHAASSSPRGSRGGGGLGMTSFGPTNRWENDVTMYSTNNGQNVGIEFGDLNQNPAAGPLPGQDWMYGAVNKTAHLEWFIYNMEKWLDDYQAGIASDMQDPSKAFNETSARMRPMWGEGLKGWATNKATAAREWTNKKVAQGVEIWDTTATTVKQFSGSVMDVWNHLSGGDGNFEFPKVRVKSDGDYMYSICLENSVLDKTCLSVQWVRRTTRIRIFMHYRGNMIFKWAGPINPLICLAESDLMRILTWIPVLLPYKPVLDRIIKKIGYCPIHVFELCFGFKDIQWTETREVSGCTYIDAQVMCLFGQCVQQWQNKVGCWNFKY